MESLGQGLVGAKASASLTMCASAKLDGVDGGGRLTREEACSDHGICAAPDKCKCDEGWTGEKCETEAVVGKQQVMHIRMGESISAAVEHIGRQLMQVVGWL